MKLSESLQNIGRPLAYYPNLARALRSVTAGVFLCQIFYWQDKTTDERGVYKSMKELEMETGLSEEEQATARRKLRDKGILLETYVRLDHRMYYKIDLDALDKFYDDYLNSLNHNQTVNPGFGKPGKPEWGNRESPVRETVNAGFVKTETTTEITSKNTTTTEDAANNEIALCSIKAELLKQSFVVTDAKLLELMRRYGVKTVSYSAEYTTYKADNGLTIPRPDLYLEDICNKIVQGAFQPGSFLSSAEKAEKLRQKEEGKRTRLERLQKDRASPDDVKRECTIIQRQGGLYGQ